jgi:SagB-type dehydrogenase family enzyme
MKRRPVSFIFSILAVLFVFAAGVSAKEAESIKLPAPQTQSGKPLMQALQERRSSRAFSSKKLSLQVISDMLWAACGINRQGSGLKTAPSAMNMQEIDIYVSMAEGLYLYDAEANRLTLVLAKDIRAVTGKQDFVAVAPLDLIYVANLAKMSKLSAQDAQFYVATDTGFISQNVYLYCASEGLATVVRGFMDVSLLSAEMQLKSDQKIILSQTVGYPAE